MFTFMTNVLGHPPDTLTR